MNKQLIFKEWKEKLWIPIFAMAFLVLFAVTALVFSGERDFLDYVTWAIGLFFLPLIGILLGASAFSSEFKDGSWAYLFSRPLKKSSIWLSKAAALAGLLVAIFVVYYLFLPLLPGFRERLIEIPLWRFSAFLSFGLFLVSFSLSYLTEKQFLVVFFSLFISAGFSLLLLSLLRAPSMTDRNAAPLIILVWVLGAIVSGAASLFAFCRTDFSRPKSKIFGFLKALAVFFAAGVILGTAAFKIEEQFQHLTFLRMVPNENEFVFYSNRGAFRYDPDRNQVIKLKGMTRSTGDRNISAGSGKIAWLKESKIQENQIPELHQEVWIMDMDGRNKRVILKTSPKTDSPLQGQILFQIGLSPDGRKLILTSCPEMNHGQQKVWSMNSDGTDLKAHPHDIPNIEWIYGLGWSSDNRRALIQVTSKVEDKQLSNKRILRLFVLSPDSREWLPLPEDISGTAYFGSSPDGNRLGYFGSDASGPVAPQNILRYIDIETLVVTDIISVSGLEQACWNPKGDQIAVLADHGRRLSVVSVPEKKILAERTMEASSLDRLPGTMAWTKDGKSIALTDFMNSSFVLQVYDTSLRVEKTYPLPQGAVSISSTPFVYGADNKILVFDFSASRLWSFDPATEKWKKLF